MAAAELLQYLTSISMDYRTNLPSVEPLMAELAEKLPEPTSLYVAAVWQTKFAKKEYMTASQDLERLYWQNPDGAFEDNVFNSYVYAGAFASARRFYVQTRKNILSPVNVSNGRGRTAFVMGYAMNDPELRRMAMEDSSSGSASDMMMHIWDAALRDDVDDLQKNAQEMIERYETTSGPNSRGRRLMKFLSLIPALKDPAHPSRRQALSYFVRDANWIILRWIWIEKYKIPSKDALVLLGGMDTDAFRRVLISYLSGNAASTEDAFKHYKDDPKRTMDALFLSHYLTHKILKQPAKADEDLKPAKSTTTRELLAAKLKLE